MVDETLFNTKITELSEEAIKLEEERKSIIDNHSIEVDTKVKEETEKFIAENKEKFIYDVVGKELEDVDKRILINKELIKTLNSLVIPEVIISEESLTVETDLNNL